MLKLHLHWGDLQMDEDRQVRCPAHFMRCPECLRCVPYKVNSQRTHTTVQEFSVTDSFLH